MTQDHITIGPIRPGSGALARTSGAAISQVVGAGDLMSRLQQAEQDLRSLQNQILAHDVLLRQTISVPMFLGSGDNHQAGVVPDPGATAGIVNFLREDGTFAGPFTVATPANSAAAGNDGQIEADNAYLYIHTGGNWRRVAVATF